MPKKPIENMLATLYIYDENEKFFPVGLITKYQ